MKKISVILSTFAVSAALSAQTAVTNSGVVVSDLPPSINPTVSTLGGGAIEYRDYTPELSVELLSVSAAVGFESEYVFRGERRSSSAIQPKVELAYPLYGLDFYVGAWSSSPVKGDNASNLMEVDLYGGVNYYVGPLRLDLGYIFYWYPSDDLRPGQRTRDMEVYIGASFDTASYLWEVNLNPSVYYYYNWILQQHVVEVSIGYNVPIGYWLWNYPRLTLPINIYGGYLTAGQKLGDVAQKDSATYWYYGASADIALAITEYCTISAGVRYSYRSGGNEGEAGNTTLLGRENNFWFGGKVDFGF